MLVPRDPLCWLSGLRVNNVIVIIRDVIDISATFLARVTGVCAVRKREIGSIVFFAVEPPLGSAARISRRAAVHLQRDNNNQMLFISELK